MKDTLFYKCKYTDTDIETIKSSEINHLKFASFMDFDLWVELGNYKFIVMKTRTLQKIIQKANEWEEKCRKLNVCCELNNKGIELEKSGNITEAIKVYEQNIVEGCYPARHSFDRLIVLYGKAKDNENKIRVLKSAIKLFNDKKYIDKLNRTKQ